MDRYYVKIDNILQNLIYKDLDDELFWEDDLSLETNESYFSMILDSSLDDEEL